MSLYREAGSRRKAVLIATAVALLVAFVGGFVLGRSSVGEPKASEVVERVRADLRPVVNGLELLPGEYEQAQAGSGAEAVGVEGTVKRIEDSVRAALPDMRALAPEGARELETSVDALAAAVRNDAPPAQVEQLTTAARSALGRLPGGR